MPVQTGTASPFSVLQFEGSKLVLLITPSDPARPLERYTARDEFGVPPVDLSMAFADTLRALNAVKADGVIEEYAIAGAMAILFWTEPVPTFDLDVLVFLPPAPSEALVSLDPLYRWTQARGYPAVKEHILIEGVRTQFLPSPAPLADEAIETAATLDYHGIPVRVVRPEYLVALYSEPSARTAKRRERAAMLLDWPGLNRKLLDEILDRHDISL